MNDISLADVARALDAMLDDQMTGQDGRLRRIVRSTPIGEIHVAELDGGVVCTSLPVRPGGAADLPHAVAGGDVPRFVQVGLPIADGSPVSPRFGEARPG